MGLTPKILVKKMYHNRRLNQVKELKCIYEGKHTGQNY